MTRIHLLPRPPRPAVRLGWLAILGVAALLVALPMGASAGADSKLTWTDPGASWTNGLVLCTFSGTTPRVAVSALSLNESGMTVQLGSIQEFDRAGVPVAVANSANASWTISNLSTPDAYDLEYTASVPITNMTLPVTVLGSVRVSLQFILPVYADSSPANLTEVSAKVSLTNWSWQHADDRMALGFAFAPAYPSSEHLTEPGTGGTTMTSTSNQTGQPLETFSANATATVGYAGGHVAVVPVTPSFQVASSSGSVTALIGNASLASFQSMNYTAHVGILLPATIAGIPIYEFAAVGTVAGLVSVLLAVGVRRVRGKPSDLTYVEEPE